MCLMYNKKIYSEHKVYKANIFVGYKIIYVKLSLYYTYFIMRFTLVPKLRKINKTSQHSDRERYRSVLI